MGKAEEKLKDRLKQFLDGLENSVVSQRAMPPLAPISEPEEVVPDTWRLQLGKERILERIMMISHYRAKGEFTETGNMLDDYAVTEDESDVVGYSAERAMDEAWLLVSRMGKNIKDAYSFIPGYDLWLMEFEMIPDYDRNVFNILTGVIEDFVVWKVLADWWKIKGYDRGAQMALVQFDGAEQKLRSCVHWRKKCIQRPGSVF